MAEPDSASTIWEKQQTYSFWPSHKAPGLSPERHLHLGQQELQVWVICHRCKTRDLAKPAEVAVRALN